MIVMIALTIVWLLLRFVWVYAIPEPDPRYIHNRATAQEFAQISVALMRSREEIANGLGVLLVIAIIIVRMLT